MSFSLSVIPDFFTLHPHKTVCFKVCLNKLIDRMKKIKDHVTDPHYKFCQWVRIHMQSVSYKDDCRKKAHCLSVSANAL